MRACQAQRRARARAARPRPPGRHTTAWTLPAAALLGAALLAPLDTLRAEEPGEAPLNAVAYAGRPCGVGPGGAIVEGDAHGVVIEGTVSVKREPGRGPTVWVSESVAGGAGDMWRATVWLAAFNAAQGAEVSISDHAFSLQSSGLIDGPSAGMLLTVKFMALLRGDDLRADTTMTGTINPDGSIGPVGGILHKMEGAAAAGFKRFGYPIGLQTERDQRTCQLGNVEVHGRSLGLEVQALRDYRDAYAFFTGVELPRPAPVAESAMRFDPAEQQRYMEVIAGLQTDYDQALADLRRSAEQASAAAQAAMGSPWFQDLARRADHARREAESLVSSGLFAAAAWRLEEARSLVVFIPLYVELVEHLARGDHAGVNTLLDEVRQVTRELGEKLHAALFALLNEHPSIGARIELIDYFAHGARALYLADRGASMTAFARDMMARLSSGDLDPADPSLAQTLLEASSEALWSMSNSIASSRTTMTQISIGGVSHDTTRAQLGAARSLASGFNAASRAGLNYFDAIFIQPQADQAGVSLASMQSRLTLSNPDYGRSRTISDILVSASQRGDALGDAQLIYHLALGAEAYVSTASLINQYYALSLDPTSGTISNRQALTSQLDLARARALEAAGLCQAELGFIPSASRRHFQNAVAFREGSDADKLVALSEFWYATFWSEMAVRFAHDPEIPATLDDAADDGDDDDSGPARPGDGPHLVLIPRVGFGLAGSATAAFDCRDWAGNLCDDDARDARTGSDASSVALGLDVLAGLGPDGRVRLGLGLHYTPSAVREFDATSDLAALSYGYGSEARALGVIEYAPRWGWLSVPIRVQGGLLTLFPSAALGDDIDGYCDAASVSNLTCAVDEGPFFGWSAGGSLGVGFHLGPFGLRLDALLEYFTVDYWRESIDNGLDGYAWSERLEAFQSSLSVGLEFEL